MHRRNELAALLITGLLLLAPCGVGCTTGERPFHWTVPSETTNAGPANTVGLMTADFYEQRRNGHDMADAFADQPKYRELFDLVTAEQQRWIERRGAESAHWQSRARFLGTKGNVFLLYPPINIYINQRWANQSHALGSQQDASLFVWAHCPTDNGFRWHQINTQLPYGNASLSSDDEQYLIVSWSIVHTGVSVYRITPQEARPMHVPADHNLSMLAISATKWAGISGNSIQFGEIVDDALHRSASIPFDTSKMTWSNLWITRDGNAAILGNFFAVHRTGEIEQLSDVHGELYLHNPPDTQGIVHSVAYAWTERGDHERLPVKIDTTNAAITFTEFPLPRDAEVLSISPCGKTLIARADSKLSFRQRRLMHPPHVGFRVLEDNTVEFLGTTSAPTSGWFVPQFP